MEQQRQIRCVREREGFDEVFSQNTIPPPPKPGVALPMMVFMLNEALEPV